MKKSIIDDIYFCDRTYYEETANTTEYIEAEKDFTVAYNKFIKSISAELKERLDEMICLHLKIADSLFAQKFSDGFKLGFKIAHELLAD